MKARRAGTACATARIRTARIRTARIRTARIRTARSRAARIHPVPRATLAPQSRVHDSLRLERLRQSEGQWLGESAEICPPLLTAAEVEVLKGYKGNLQLLLCGWGLRALRDGCRAAMRPDDAELRQISTWVRHNRAAAGSLQVVDAAPDLPLHSIGLPESPAATSSVLRACDGKPTLLVAGSLT